MNREDLFSRYAEIDNQLLTIDLMEGHDFEYWCADLLRKIGFTNVMVTQGSGDHGVDVLAEKDGIRHAIQCKCYSKDLGNTPIQEVSAGKMMPQYRCQVGAVITNRYFTKGAQELADATGTLLWDRNWIKQHLTSSSLAAVTESSLQDDALYSAAVDFVLEIGHATVPLLQRKFGIGYAKAARIIDKMEENGVVGPFQGSRPRVILIGKSEPRLESSVTSPRSNYCGPDLDEPVRNNAKEFVSIFKFITTQMKLIFPVLKKLPTFLFCWASCILFMGIFAAQVLKASWGIAGNIIYIILIIPIPILLSLRFIFNKPNNKIFSKFWFWFLCAIFLANLVPVILE